MLENTTESGISEETFIQMLPDTLYDLLMENRTDEIIAEYCPGLMKCSDILYNKSSVQLNLTDAIANGTGQGCCLPCECSPDCFARGTCCSDVERSRSDPPEFESYTSDGRTCIDTFVLEYERKYTTQDKLYLLKQTCLNSFTGVDINGRPISTDELIYRCSFPDEFQLLDVTPVTSLASNQSYRNLFCAYCNNDGTSLVDWELSLTCFSNEDLPKNLFNEQSTSQEVFQRILQDRLCSVTWSQPPEILVESCFASKYMMSDCPYYVPEFIVSLCRDELYFIPYRGNDAVYRNVFCYVCNFYRMNEQLYDPTDDGRCPADDFIGSDFISFSVLLDFKTLSTAKTEKPGLEIMCENDLTYNYELVCMVEYHIKSLIIFSLGSITTFF